MSTQTRDLVVVGASAGGVEALRALCATFPADLTAAVLVVLHLPSEGTSTLPAILARSGRLPARTARSGESLEHGTIYVAPPDHHLLVDDAHLLLTRGPAENGHRPAINALFRSAALTGPRVTGVVLSGNLDDGAAGLDAIVRRGGYALVQDPGEALYSGMPEAALARVGAPEVLPVAELGKRLGELARQPISEVDVEPPDDALRHEVALARDGDRQRRGVVKELGPETEFSCPDCGGVLVHVGGGGTYRCHVGHGWTLEALHQAKDSAMEGALWMALRTLEEKATLSERMEVSANGRGVTRIGRRYREEREAATDAAAVLRELLMGPRQGAAPARG